MIKSFLQGLVIGIANILPGVSGGTMMVAMGIYDKLIHCITHFFSEFKKNIKFLLPIFIGAGVALLGLSFLIEPAFAYFPLETNCLFIGLIMGGIPAILGRMKDGEGKFRVKIGYVIPAMLFFALVVGLALAENLFLDYIVALTVDFWSFVKLFFVGVIAAATMVIPGVSGSMVLLLLGYYTPIIETINAFVKSALALDFAGVWANGIVLVPLAVGIVVGFFAIAKLIEIALAKFPIHSYWAVLGLILASPIGILLVAEIASVTLLNVVISIVTFALGFFVAMKLGD